MNIEEIFDDIKDGVGTLAENTLKDFVQSAKDDLDAFLEESGEAIERRATMLAKGELTPQEFKFLTKMEVDLAEFHILTAMGIAQTRLERFRQGLISLIIKSVFAAI